MPICTPQYLCLSPDLLWPCLTVGQKREGICGDLALWVESLRKQGVQEAAQKAGHEKTRLEELDLSEGSWQAQWVWGMGEVGALSKGTGVDKFCV